MRKNTKNKITVLGIWVILIVGMLFIANCLGLPSDSPIGALSGSLASIALAGFLVPTAGANRTVKIFTRETCQKMLGMDLEERRQKLAGVLTAFFQGKLPSAWPTTEIAKEAGVDEELVQKVLSIMGRKGATGPDDAPNIMNRNTPITAGVFYTAMVDPLLDYGFEELFDFVDMRGSGQTSFDILDITNLITFAEVRTSQRMKVYGVSDAKSLVEKMTIAAAIGIMDDWINYAQFWNLNQAALEARSKYYDKMAGDHYTLLAAISSDQNQAFDTDDVTTINNACATILTELEGKGYNITGNEVFELRANINLKQRIEKAFALTFNSPNSDKNQLVHTINRKYTTKLASTTYYVGLSGRKAKRGIWSDLSAETDRDILLRGTDIAYSGEYNAAIGEEDQFRRCSLS